VLELVVVAALILVVSSIAIPQALASLDRSRGLAAARFLAARMALVRAQAVGRTATMALVFERGARGIAFRVHQDGNRNGVRTADIESRIDRPVEDAVRLFELFPGVAIGITPEAPTDDPISLGGTEILSFTPYGTSSSGTIYIRGRDGTQWAVRVLGATARTRVLRYVPERREWVNPY
jgi:type II secretory pathway pseudopilin PulG